MNGSIKKLVVFLFALTLVLSSCGTGEVNKDIVGEITCITKDNFSKVGEEEVSTLQNIVNKFSVLFPKIKVTINLVKNDEDFIPQVLKELGSESPPDVILASPEDMLYIKQSAEKTFLELDSILIGEDTATTEEKTYVINENVLSLAKLGGEKNIYYPFAVSANLMAFNKNILDSVSMTEKLPKNESRSWTFEEYAAFITELSEKLPNNIDTGVFYYGTIHGSQGTKRLITNAYSAKYTAGGTPTINSEEGVKGLQGISEILSSGNMVNGFTVELSNNIEKFINGEIAHTIHYNLGYDLNYKKDKKDNFQTIFLPYPSSTEAKLDYNALGGSIIEGSDENKKEMSKLFLNFIGNTNGFSDYIAGTAGMYSPVKEYNEFLKDEYSYLALTLDMLDDYSFAPSQNHEAQWIYMLRKVLFLDQNPKESLDFFVANSEEFVFSEKEPVEETKKD